MTVYALRLDNNVDTAARVRMADMLALPAGAAPLTSKSALRFDGGGVVAVASGTMNVQVAPFIAWVQGGVSVAQGGYPFVNDATVTLGLAAGHASLSRTDTIAGVVRDNPADGSGTTDARVVVIQGTPGAGAPALPTNCVPLRDVVIPAGTSAGNGGLSAANLSTDRRKYLTVPPQTGSVTAITDANGDLNIAFATPFPAGVTPVFTCSLGDDRGTSIVNLRAFLTNTGTRVRIRTGTSPLANQAARVDYAAYMPT